MNDTCHICGESDNLVPVTIKDETIFLCPGCKEAHLKQCSQCDDFFIDTENDYAKPSAFSTSSLVARLTSLPFSTGV